MNNEITASPGYWMHETSGVLRPAIEAYLRDPAPLRIDHIAAIRAYLRQWINAPGWKGDGIATLQSTIDSLDTRAAIDTWLATALEWGIDPL